MTRCHPPEFERACLIDTKTVKISMSCFQDMPRFCFENQWNACFEAFWTPSSRQCSRMTRCHPPEFERACLIDTRTVKISMSFFKDMPQFCFENQRMLVFELYLFILIAIYGQKYDIHRHQICINRIFDISSIILVDFLEEKYQTRY